MKTSTRVSLQRTSHFFHPVPYLFLSDVCCSIAGSLSVSLGAHRYYARQPSRDASVTLQSMDLETQQRAAYTAASDAWMLRGGGIDGAAAGAPRGAGRDLYIRPQH